MPNSGQRRSQRHCIQRNPHPYSSVFIRARLWSKSLSILGREKESKDHVPEVTRICIKRGEPVLKSRRVRIAAQVTKILHRYEGAIEELIGHCRHFNYFAQYLSTRFLSG